MHDLTRRERQVLERLCRGLSNKAIAAELEVSEQAVKAHLSRLYLKYGVANRAGLVAAVMADTAHERLDAVRDARTAALLRQIEVLTQRNTELERRHRQLRASASADAAD